MIFQIEMKKKSCKSAIMDFGHSQGAMGGDFFLVYPEGIKNMPNFSFLLIFSRS